MKATQIRVSTASTHAKDILGDNWCDYAKEAQQATNDEQLVKLVHRICKEQNIDPHACCLGLMLALGTQDKLTEFRHGIWAQSLMLLCNFLQI